MSRFPAQSIIKDAILTTRPLARKRKIIIKGNLKAFIYGDREKLAQVVINLITNALKYSKEEIILSVKEDEKFVTVSVKDFGQGIGPSEIKSLFEKYYRSKRENNSQGLGIGLYVSKEYVMAHKGKIWVESKRGEGSTFSFSVPV
jgi:signal transduction histidine kinase